MIPAAFAPLASHLWQSTVFAAAVGLLALALRRNQARVRFWLWLAASYKFLVPFALLVSVGHLFEWRAAPATVPPAFSAVTDMVIGPSFLAAVPAARRAPDHAPVLLFAIWAVWACGFVIVAVGWVREWLRMRAIARAGSPLRLDLPIRVVSSSARLEPGVFGMFRPVFLLPDGILDRLTQAELGSIIAHELCHVRRRDNLTAAIHMLVEALFWFHPIVWWLGTRLVDERERACDEEVLRAGSQAQAYAESILKVCEFYIESPLTCMSGVTGSDLKKRIQRIMKERFGVPLSAQKKLLLAIAGVAALAVPLVAGVLRLQAQSQAVPQWQIDAGGTAKFDVASVKPDMATPGPQTVNSNVTLGPQDDYPPSGGLLSVTNFLLSSYVGFAYKLNEAEMHAVQSQLPKWANTERFDIQARASGNPTKDQFRLMMQALLADRFRLALHVETHQVPVFALVLDKPRKVGPQLQLHSDNPPCPSAPASPVPGFSTTVAGGFPEICGVIRQVQPSAPGRYRIGARAFPLAMFARGLNVGTTGIDRPVLDKTGLIGKVDFVMEFTPQINGPLPPGSTFQPDPTGPTYIEALKDQLGLKLVPQTGPVDVLVVDHVEEPSPN